MTGIKKWIVETFPKVFPKNTYRYYRFLYGKTTHVYPVIEEIGLEYKFRSTQHPYTYFEDTDRPNYIGHYYVAWLNEDGFISRLGGPAIIYKRNISPRIDDFLVNKKLVTSEVILFAEEHKINLKDMTEVDKMMLKLFLTKFL